MFGRLNDVRLKAAEQALAAGRLEEAFEAAVANELVDRKRAGQLLARLFEPLMTRAQEHLLGGRFAEAMADLKRAERCCGGGGAERVGLGWSAAEADGLKRVEEWRKRAVAAMEDYQRRQKSERAALEAAANGLANGALTRAGEHLERVDEGLASREQLTEEIAAAQRRGERLAEEARAAMKADQFGIAAERVAAARRNHAAGPAVLEVSEALCKRLVERVREALAAGQLDRAAHDLELARRVDANLPEVAEAGRAMGWVREAATCIEAGEYDEAITLLGKFMQLAGAATWAKRAREDLEEVRRRLAEVVAGPLGILEKAESRKPKAEANERADGGAKWRDGGYRVPDLAGVKQSPVMNTITNVPAARGANALGKQDRRDAGPTRVPPVVDASGLPRRMIMRIDGVGSYLLLRGDRVAIGRAGGAADVPIQADLSERHAEILRGGEDYFLLGQAGVELAGQQVREALLSHGDRLRLGKRVRMTFERPSRKSGSAVLALGDGVRSLTDVKRVVLWSGPILLGPTTDCHIPVHGLLTGLMLVERGGKIQLRPMGGNGLVETIDVAVGQIVEAGPMRFSLQAVGERV